MPFQLMPLDESRASGLGVRSVSIQGPSDVQPWKPTERTSDVRVGCLYWNRVLESSDLVRARRRCLVLDLKAENPG